MTLRLGRRDLVPLAMLLAVGVALPLAMLTVAGGAGLPSNDDWVYMLGADSLYRSGTVAMPGHTAAAVGQLLLVQPLLWLSGGAPWAYNAFGLGMAALAVVTTYLLARCFVGPRPASLATLLLLTFPGYLRESTSFMTDGPTLALEMAALLLGATWLRTGRRLALAASLAVGVLTVSVREFAVAAPAAVLVASWVRSRPPDRWVLLAATVAAAASLAGVLLLAGSASVHGGLGTPFTLARLYLVGPPLATLAAGLLPALFLALGRRPGAPTVRHWATGVSLVVFAFALPTLPPLVGQLWMADGLVGNALLAGSRPPVIPAAGWSMSVGLALVAAVLLATLTARWLGRALGCAGSIPRAWQRLLRVWRRPAGVLLVFAAGYAAEIAILVALAAYPLDRYLWPLVPVLAIVLLRETSDRFPRWSTLAGRAALGWLALSALAIAANSFAYDAARWRAGEAAVAVGYSATTVDAGYEWVGYHTGGHANETPTAHGLTWYDDAFMPTRPCAVVSNSPLDKPGYVLISDASTAYRQYLLVGPDEPLYLYGSTDVGCPALPAQ